MVELPPLATTSRRGSAQSDLKLVTFTLGSKIYGVDVDDVHAIYHAMPMIPSFGSGTRIKGYLRLADKRVPVIDLRGCVNLPEHQGRGTVEWIIAISHEDGQVGFIVDEVSEVLKLHPSSLRMVNDKDSNEFGFYLKAIAKENGQKIFIPDLAHLITEVTNPK